MMMMMMMMMMIMVNNAKTCRLGYLILIYNN